MPPRVASRTPFHAADGTTLYWEERLDPKGFRLCRPGPDGSAIYNMDGVRRVLYRLPEVLAALAADQWVLVVEGPKDADTLRALGKTATTNVGGAGKWLPEYTDVLRGAKVAIIADADEPGRRHALAVACELSAVARKVLVYEPAPPHKDVTDHLAADLELNALIPLAAQPVDAPEICVLSVAELMDTPELDEHDKLLDALVLRGARLVIGAHTGEGKTSWGLQVLRSVLHGDDFLGWRGLGNGARALVIDVEQGRRTVKRRFLEMGLADYRDQIKLVWVPDGLALDSDKRHVAQIEEILTEQWDLVIADPLYKLHRGDANDERKAVDLMRLFDRWRTRFGFALILPMHCRKPQAGLKFSIHDITGSSGYTRGAEVVVGLQRVKKGYAFLHWWKDREGDLGCINERWGLLFDQERGFRRDPGDLERRPVSERVRSVLEGSPGMTLDELRDETEAKQSTLRRVLVDLGATHDGARLVADRHWQMPPTLWEASLA